MPKNSFLSGLFGGGMQTSTPSFIAPTAGPSKAVAPDLYGLLKSKYPQSTPATLTPSTTGATGPTPTPSPAKQQFVNNVAQSAMPTSNVGNSSTSMGGTMTQTGLNNPAVAAGGTANNTPSAPPDPYKASYDAYIQSLAPSDEETQANKYLNSLLSNKEQTDFDIQHRPGATTSFLGAEQERADADMARGINSASNALTALTGRRTATTDAAKARVDYENSLKKTQSPSDIYGTGSIGEYNFAKSQGYTGSFTDYQNEDANRKAKAAGTTGSLGAFNGTLSPLAQAVQNNTIPITSLPSALRAQVAAELATSGIPNPRQQAMSSDLDVVNELLNSDTNAITGIGQNPLNAIGLTNQKTINLYNQLKGILSLENRQQLKGQGAISDFEFKVLADAASSLGRNLSNKDFKETLQKVKDVLSGRYATLNQTQPTGTAGATSGTTPSGITYTVEK